jgi:Ca-activated chloride channel homolog
VKHPLLVVLLGGLLSAGSARAQTAADAPPQTTFRSGIDLVALNVTVTDQSHNYVSGLTVDDFAVFEDGVQQELRFFAASQTPLDLLLLIDTSASMRDRIETVQTAALGFIRTLEGPDRGAVVTFDGAIRVLQNLTSDRAALEEAVGQIEARGATSLYNALYISLKEFERAGRREGEVRRQAIVLLSDGEDTSSLLSFEDVQEEARRIGVNVYTIFLESEFAQLVQAAGARPYFSQARYVMRALAQESGARAFFPKRVEELEGLYAQIARELSHQYSLGYASNNPRRDGAFRRVVVRVVERPELRPRTRMGYVAEAARMTFLSR